MSSSSHQNPAPLDPPEATSPLAPGDEHALIPEADNAMEPVSIEEIGDAEMELLDDVLDPDELDDFDDLASLDADHVEVIEEPVEPPITRRRREGGDLLDTLEMPVFKVPEEDEAAELAAQAPAPAAAAPAPERADDLDPEEAEAAQRAIPLSGILRGRTRNAREEDRTTAPLQADELPEAALLPDLIQRRPTSFGIAWLNGPPPGSIPDHPAPRLRPAREPEAAQASPAPEAPAPAPTPAPAPAPTAQPLGVPPGGTAMAQAPASPALAAAPPPPKPTPIPGAPPSAAPPAAMPAPPVAVPAPPIAAPATPAAVPAPPAAVPAPPVAAQAPPTAAAAPPIPAQAAPAVPPPTPLDPAMLFSTRVPGGEKAFTIIRPNKRHKAQSQDELSGLVKELLGEEPAGKKAVEEEPPQTIPWWQLIFTEEYFRTIPMGFHRQTIREARFISDSLGVGEGAAILDLCCGFGRHTIELAKRGYDMAGLDLSMPLLQKALREAQRRNLSIKFIHGDVRELSFDSIFDAIFTFQTSFGYFDDRTNFNILRGVTRALKPGGRFMVEVVNRDWVVPSLPLRIWWEGPECLFLEEVEMDFASSALHTKRSFIYDDGRPPWEQNIYIRAFSLHELRRMVELAGLRVVSISGSIYTRGHFLGPDSPQIIILAEKPMG